MDRRYKGDGRNDVVTTTGWFEAPANPSQDPWTWHDDYQFEGGGAGLPILITHVNGDGLNDIIMGSAHKYGLAWFEQRMADGSERLPSIGSKETIRRSIQ